MIEEEQTEQAIFLQALGLEGRSVSRPDEEAPPVQRELLLALARKQLSKEDTRNVLRLVALYRPWHRCYNEVLIEEYKNSLAVNKMPCITVSAGPHEAPVMRKNGNIQI